MTVLIILVVGGVLVSAGTAHAAGWQTCSDLSWPGDKGVVNARISPNGYIAWNAIDYTDNFGHWTAWVYINSRQVDKKDQTYNPHGSVSPADARPGSLFHLTVLHIDSKGDKSFSDPNAGCIVPS